MVEVSSRTGRLQEKQQEEEEEEEDITSIIESTNSVSVSTMID